MPSSNAFKSKTEVDEAYSEAVRGGVVGAAKWGFVAAFAGATGYALSPKYRGLTIQFKVFLQISVMTLGGIIEADRRMRLHEMVVRQRKRMARYNAHREQTARQLRDLELEEEEWEKSEAARRKQAQES